MNDKELFEYIGFLLNRRGWNAIKVMLGSTYAIAKDDFRVPANLRGKQGAEFNFKLNRKYNTCQIVYDRGLDLFDMVLFKNTPETVDFRTGKLKGGISNVKVFKGLYFEDLKETFERNTGLYTSL